MKRAYYSDTIEAFVATEPRAVLGDLSGSAEGALEKTQSGAWEYQIQVLQPLLKGLRGNIYFEFSIPRMGRRIDVVLVIGAVIFVLEFKVGARSFEAYAADQVWDYALDLKNFHSTSHSVTIAPVLIATEAEVGPFSVASTPHADKLLFPIQSNSESLRDVIARVNEFVADDPIEALVWERGVYNPTPTIIEAALALYQGHSVSEISRSDGNLHVTTEAISDIIASARTNSQKTICFVTGVPGAGKTLIGLNIATKHLGENSDSLSVFLSGNGPLVTILQVALARDLVARKKLVGERLRIKEALSQVKAFVQNVHHYRDNALVDEQPPVDHVALFDEAQRAWDLKQTASFMAQKKNRPGFAMSEPEFLISCLDRHPDWGVVVCLVGGGQEINTGEAGITEWIAAINRSFPSWHIHISSKLSGSEYGAGKVLESIANRPNVVYRDELHLSVSMRSFRAENVSLLIKQLLDLDVEPARTTLAALSGKYPIVVTRDLSRAKHWLRGQARGSERYGLVASSQAQRLKPHAIDVKTPMDPVHWFLDGKEDVRSSYYLEDVATEFSVQGLELDWTCVTWDGDFRHTPDGWEHRSFCGSKWQNINKPERQTYLKNAYRVLLTRARQGMVIVVPHGDTNDPTRNPTFYDPTYEYLQSLGFSVI